MLRIKSFWDYIAIYTIYQEGSHDLKAFGAFLQCLEGYKTVKTLYPSKGDLREKQQLREKCLYKVLFLWGRGLVARF